MAKREQTFKRAARKRKAEQRARRAGKILKTDDEAQTQEAPAKKPAKKASSGTASEE